MLLEAETPAGRSGNASRSVQGAAGGAEAFLHGRRFLVNSYAEAHRRGPLIWINVDAPVCEYQIPVCN